MHSPLHALWRKPRRLGLALLLVLTGVARAGEASISIGQAPPQIVRRSYDPQNPPAEMIKKLKLPEAGLCQSDFGCKILTATGRIRIGDDSVDTTVVSVRLVMHLDITIWTVIESTPKLRDHEEGHREINEDYYRRAGEVALALARGALGTKLTASRQRGERGIEEARETLQRNLAAEFLRQTAERCVEANDRYDAITAHGANRIPETVALRQAIAEERAQSAR